MKKRAGCWADGAFGHEHVRQCLADEIELCFAPHSKLAHVVHTLRGPMTDDAWEEYEALDALNDAAPEGMTWCFHDGDLIHHAITDCDV